MCVLISSFSSLSFFLTKRAENSAKNIKSVVIKVLQNNIMHQSPGQPHQIVKSLHPNGQLVASICY